VGSWRADGATEGGSLNNPGGDDDPARLPAPLQSRAIQMHITSLPVLGVPVILTGETGATWALGTFNADPAYLLVAVADGHGRPVIWNLLDEDTEAALLALLQARAAIRTAATIPPFKPGAAP
jgi:hypothetical protein